MKDTVPSITIVFLALSALFNLGAPITLLIIAVKKFKAKVFPAIIGALTFVLFALALEPISHSFFLSGSTQLATTIRTTPVLYILYAGLAAGIFEEVGRFCAYKLVLRKRLSDKSTSLSYGIGHGGIEAILLVGLGMINMIILAVMINRSGAAAFLATIPAEQQAAVSQQINSLLYIDGMGIFWGCFERASAIMLHISLSVWVYAAVTDKRFRLLFPAAILAHALVDMFVVHYSLGIISNIVLLEIVLFASSLLLAFTAVKLYKKLASPNTTATDSAAAQE